MKLIDKDKLAAEIEKRRSKNSKNKLNLAAAFEDNYLLSFLDTLEVEEVDLVLKQIFSLEIIKSELFFLSMMELKESGLKIQAVIL